MTPKVKGKRKNAKPLFPFSVSFSLRMKGGDRNMKRILLALAAWTAGITALHLSLNVNWPVLLNDRLPEAQRRLNVAYIPVT
jgi:hypothetical protein